VGLFTSFRLKSRDAGTRKRAAASLGASGRISAVSSLQPLLDDPDWGVRQAAVESLGRIEDVSATPLLLEAVKGADHVPDQDGAAAVRAAAVEALGRIGAPAVPALLEALHGRHVKLRETAIGALGAIGGPAAVAALGEMVADDRSSVRQAAMAALVRAAGQAAIPALATALAHKDPMTRKCAADTLGTLHESSAVTAVRTALSDRDRTVRDAAVRALSAIGRPEAVSALVAGMRTGERDLQAAIASALKSFEWAPADASERVVHAAVHGRFDEAASAGADAVEPLVAVLADRDPSMRQGALAALGRLADARAAAAIAVLFKDPDTTVRQAAADALAAIGPAAAETLLESLRDRTATVRAAAGRALSLIGESRVAAALLGRLAVGHATRHGETDLRVVATREELDAARKAVDGLDSVLRHAAAKLSVDALRQIVKVADVIHLEPGEVPGDSDRADAGPVREAAHEEMGRRGITPA
jgi:HEAT repeat protein